MTGLLFTGLSSKFTVHLVLFKEKNELGQVHFVLCYFFSASVK
jgi:hypothetical protein